MWALGIIGYGFKGFKLKIFKQKIKDGKHGDCFRTCFAMILESENIEDIPNFAKDGEDKMFNENYKNWIDNSEYEYIEIPVNVFIDNISLYFPSSGYCIVVGKSPRGEYDHAVVGEIKTVNDVKEINLVADPYGVKKPADMLDSFKSIGCVFRKLYAK